MVPDAPAPDGRYGRPRPTAAVLAEAAAAAGQRQLLHREPAGRAAAGDGLRERPLSQPARMLLPPHRHVHDPRQRLHAAVRLLLRPQGGAGGAGGRRTGPRGRSGAPARPPARRHHVGDARRPARRRRRPLPPLRPGRARAHRGRRRGADARLPRRPGRRRCRAVGGAGSLQPQHGDGAAPVQEGARPGRRISAASTCWPTSSGVRRRP